MESNIVDIKAKENHEKHITKNANPLEVFDKERCNDCCLVGKRLAKIFLYLEVFYKWLRRWHLRLYAYAI